MNLIDHLPSDSYFAEALSQDEELAEQLADRPESDRKERVSEWSPLRAELVAIVERLESLQATIIATSGGKPSRPKPRPRPETALDRVRRQQRYAKHRSLVDRLLPR